jgi:hypothetical protein
MKDSEAGPRSTQMVQSTATNRVMGVIGLITTLFFGYMLWDSDHGFWAVTLILVVGTVCGIIVVTGMGGFTAACPLCDKVFPLDWRKHNRCPWCFAYSEADIPNKRLVEIEQARVESTPTFLLPLAREFQLPKICCACGRSAFGTRRGHLTYNLQNQILPGTKHIEYWLDIPYCELHADSTNDEESGWDSALDYRSKKPDSSSQYPVPGLKVSSYRFYRAYVVINAIQDHVKPKISV